MTEPTFVGSEYEFTFTIVPHWLLKLCKPTEIATYVALGQYADNKSKECWPSVTTLAKDLDRSRQSTIKALKGLEEKGVIQIKERFKDKGEQTSNLYILMLSPKGVSRKLNRGGKKNKTPRRKENVTQTKLNITKTKELYFREYTKDKQTEYVEELRRIFKKENPNNNEWGQLYKSAQLLFQSKITVGQIETLTKNIILSYGERAATVNSIPNHTELVHGAKTKTSKDMQELVNNQDLERWINENS